MWTLAYYVCINCYINLITAYYYLQVPSAVWSPFYLSLVENLVNRNGILNFFHDHLRQAVESKYLPTPDDKKQGYLQLANFFSKRPVDDRVVRECN